MMQLIRSTAAMEGGDPWDPEENILMGARYLGQLSRQFHGDLGLTLAAYNAGPAAVTRNGYKIPPYAETTAYVPKVLSLYAALQR
jgi:soluble lytic murein transglycosylase-like protein